MQGKQKIEPTSRKGCRYAKIPLIAKIRLFKSVLEDGVSIKKISQKLQIKYSTAKTLVRQFKDQHIKIDLGAFGSETPSGLPKVSEKKICHYRQIEGVSECFFSKEEKESSNKEMNALDTFEEKAASSEDVSAQFKSGSKIEIISTTLWQI